jgi:CheY-like chemotaxis protein
MVVEDEPDAVLLLKRAFQKAEISNPVQIVESGAAALAYLQGDGPYSDRAAHPMPDILLLDLKLPFVSGLEVLKWIKSHVTLRKLPVVVLTSSREVKDIEAAYNFGANSYLVKPMSLQLLTSVMQAFREYWLRHNEPPPMLRG